MPVYIRVAEQIKAEWFLSAGSNNGRKLPTQEELAGQFRVSRATIVRALSKLVAEGYLHSQQGSGVYIAESRERKASTPCIGLIVPTLNAPVIVQTCRGVERRVRQLGHRVLLAASEGGLSHERDLVEQYLQAGVRGIVLYPVTRRREEIADDYLVHWSNETPIVTMDIGCEEWRCSRVLFDNYRLGYDVTQHLLRHGHRRIAFMHTAPEWLHSSIHDRQKGWMAAMAEAGLEIPPDYRGWPAAIQDMAYERPLVDAAYEIIVDSLLSLQPRPDAVIAWTDVEAVHLIQLLTTQGIRVPEEIRITGFDCEPLISALFRPLFPTTKPDFIRLGEMAVDALQWALEGGASQTRIYYYPVPVLWREPRRSTSGDRVATERKEVGVDS